MRKLSPTFTWLLSIALALFFAAQGLSKLWGTTAEVWSSRFLNWGYPPGFHFVVGVVELVSGLALLLPWSRRAGAFTLMLVMVGALFTHLIHGELPRVIPALILGMATFLLFLFSPRLERQDSSS